MTSTPIKEERKWGADLADWGEDTALPWLAKQAQSDTLQGGALRTLGKVGELYSHIPGYDWAEERLMQLGGQTAGALNFDPRIGMMIGAVAMPDVTDVLPGLGLLGSSRAVRRGLLQPTRRALEDASTAAGNRLSREVAQLGQGAQVLAGEGRKLLGIEEPAQELAGVGLLSQISRADNGLGVNDFARELGAGGTAAKAEDLGRRTTDKLTLKQALELRAQPQRRGAIGEWLALYDEGAKVRTPNSQYFEATTKQIYDELSVTGASTHHIHPLMSVAKAIDNFGGGDNLVSTQLTKLLFADGWRLGDSIDNYVTAFDTTSQAMYQQTKKLLKEAFPNLDERTIIQLQKEIPFQELKKIPKNKTVASLENVDEYLRLNEKSFTSILEWDGNKVTADVRDTIRRLEGIMGGTNEIDFPDILDAKKQLLFKPKTVSEYQRRWSKATGNSEADRIAKDIINSVKNDPDYNIISHDHMTGFHENYDKLASQKKLDDLITTGKFSSLKMNEARDLIGNVLEDQRSIVVNYLRAKVEALDKKIPGFN